ncbi:lipoprotein, YaeC family [Butyrivibrio sp. YAB3001]|nr:MetQ/NlpA family ABC transporter substrate-binding protein [Butyrivibrio sp. YAB3001]SFC21757.1 lipoprotein, YaeC family [Butyrivibrio sp. YAB3001]
MKKKLFKKVVASVSAAALGVAALAGCGSSSEQPAAKADSTASEASAQTGDENKIYRTLDEIKESGKVNIGVFSDKNPFGYVDENGAYQGYDVYFAERIGKDLGVEINYVSTEAASRVEYLETGKVDIVLANFTVTEERAQKVDFALPYMNVALGVVSHEDNVIEDLSQISADDQVIVISGTTAETYLEKNYPDIKLQKFDTYATAKTSFENGTGVAWANDNTEVIAYAIENHGYVVGIPSLGSQDTIAPAVSKGNSTLLDWLNNEIVSLGGENFFHADYEATLIDTYGKDYEETLVVEGGKVAGSTETAAAGTASDAAALDIVPGNGETIKIAASPVPHAEILAKAADILKDYGYNLDIVEFEDYVQPNLVVESGEFDANYMEHVPYLNSFNEEQGTHIVDAGDIHYEPFGIYPGKKKSLDEVADGDKIAIPNDTTNEARALLLLQDNGLLKLKDGADLKVTVNDIVENPYNIEFVELEAAQVARVVNEVSYVVLNGNYALEAGYSVGKDSIAYESSDSVAAKTYVNIIGVLDGNENSDKIKALVTVLRSADIKKFIEDTYDGAVIFFES